MIRRVCHHEPERSEHDQTMTPRAIHIFIVCLILLPACASPEAGRTRGGGPGADVKNWGRPIELHAGAEPYHDTPCAMEPVECKGPLPVFGSGPPPD